MNGRTVLVAVFSIMSLIAVTHYADLRIDVKKIDYALFGVGFVVFVVNYTLRAFRFSRLFTGDVHFQALWTATGVHGSLTYLFPARLGEISFPFLARYMGGLPVEQGTAALIASRMLDLFLVVVMSVVIILSGIIPLPGNILAVEWLFFALALFVMAGWGVRSGFLRSAISHIPLVNGKFAKIIDEILYSFEVLALRKLCISLMLTVAIWSTIWLNFYLLAHAVGCPLEWPQAVAISLIMVPLSLLPVQGVANLGTFEFAWSLVLTAAGVGINQALGWTFEVHLLLSLHVVMLGLLSCILWFFKAKCWQVFRRAP